MKRRIFKTLTQIKKKFVLCMMLASFAAINTGFTVQDEIPEITAQDTAPIEEASANEPTAIAINENGRLKVSENDELARMFSELVEESRRRDISKLTGATFEEETSQADEISETESPENFVETSGGYVPYSQMISMEATAYLPTDGGSAEGLTAIGIPATYGIVAVDPDVIPLGSKVYIPGYGEALAADTGGAIYGYRIDLCMEDYWQAMDFGRRVVDVFVLK